MLILMSNCQFQDDVNHVNEIWRWIEKNSAAAQQGLLWFLVSFAVTRLVRKNSNTRRRRRSIRRRKKITSRFFHKSAMLFFHCRHTSCQWTNETVHFVPLIYFIYQYSCRIQAKWYKLVHRLLLRRRPTVRLRGCCGISILFEWEREPWGFWWILEES